MSDPRKNAQLEIRRRRARNEIIRRAENGEAFLLYVETIFKYHYKKPFRRTWWDPMLAEALMDIYHGRETRLIIEEPPRFGKTERIVRMFGSYVQGLDMRIKIQYGTYSGTLSKLTAIDTKMIMKSEIYQEIFPEVAFSEMLDTNEHWKLKSGAEFLATSVGGSNTGIGAEIFILDDPLKAADADSKPRRDEAYNFYESSALTRLEGRKAVIIIMQRLHQDDVVGRVLALTGRKDEGGLWNVISLPVINEEEEVYHYRDMTVIRSAMTPLDAGTMDIEEIEQRKREMSQAEFRRQYMQDAFVSEAGYFLEENFRYISDLELPPMNKYIIVDPAESEESTADDRGIVVVGKHQREDKTVTTVVMDGRHGKWDVYGTCERIIDMAVRYPDAPILIEGAGGGITLAKVLKREILIYNAAAQSARKPQILNWVHTFKPDNQTTKNQGIKLMANPMEQGFLLFYRGMDQGFEAQLKREFLAFNPERKGNVDNCIDPLSKSFILPDCTPKTITKPKPKPIRRHRKSSGTWRGV